MVKVEFTQDELNTLGQIIDVAIKATGLQGAKAALPIMSKLEEAVAGVNRQPVPSFTEEIG